MKIFYSFVILYFFFFSFFQVQAQVDSTLLNPMTDIKTKEQFRYPNSYHTRYFLSPSAIPLEKGKAYYENFWGSTNGINYGITKNFSVGGGFELITLLRNEEPIWFLNTKAGFNLTEKVHLAGGLFLINTGKENFTIQGYTAATFGFPESNFTVGLNYEFGEDVFLQDSYDDPYINLSLSGMHRLSNKIGLMTENNFNMIPKRVRDLSYAGIHGIQLILKKQVFRIGVLISSRYSVSSIEKENYIFPLPYASFSRLL